MGRNAEAYVDDIVIKTRESHLHQRSGGNLRQPEKSKHQAQPRQVRLRCTIGKVVGVPHVSSRIEANPDKVKAIEEMRPPRNLKEM
jgi:hypothetical protein